MCVMNVPWCTYRSQRTTFLCVGGCGWGGVGGSNFSSAVWVPVKELRCHQACWQVPPPTEPSHRPAAQRSLNVACTDLEAEVSALPTFQIANDVSFRRRRADSAGDVSS